MVVLHYITCIINVVTRSYEASAKCISSWELNENAGIFLVAAVQSYIASAMKPFNFSARMIYFIENKNCIEQTLQRIMDCVRNEFGACELVSIKRRINPLDAFACTFDEGFIGSVMQPPMTQSQFFILISFSCFVCLCSSECDRNWKNEIYNEKKRTRRTLTCKGRTRIIHF